MSAPVSYARRLSLFDATMLVMGGIIGAGIFLNPAVVAQRVSTPTLTVGVWILGAAVALAIPPPRGHAARQEQQEEGQHARGGRSGHGVLLVGDVADSLEGRG